MTWMLQQAHSPYPDYFRLATTGFGFSGKHFVVGERLPECRAARSARVVAMTALPVPLSGMPSRFPSISLILPS